MWLLVAQSLYFFLPAYTAKMAHLILKKVSWGEKAINDQWLGQANGKDLVGGVILAGLIFYLQKLAFLGGFQQLAFISYADFSPVLGFLLGAGALAGDWLHLFYRQKVGIKEEKAWLPWDQWSYVLGGIIFSFLIYVPPAAIVFALLIVTPLLLFLFDHLKEKAETYIK